jgi:riboflavin biosynthesis pyrimidine reductase
MNVRRLIPPEPENSDINADITHSQLRSLYTAPRRVWLRLNMIQSINGSAIGADGTSNSLTNRTDRHILHRIRELSDVIVVGAKTLRIEGYTPPQTRFAIITRTGNMANYNLQKPQKQNDPPLIIFPRSVERTVVSNLGHLKAELIPIADNKTGNIDFHATVLALHSRGLFAITCEGGPHLAAQFLTNNLVDEFCLSTSPQFVFPRTPLIAETQPFEQQFVLFQLLVDDESTLYARWHRKPTV